MSYISKSYINDVTNLLKSVFRIPSPPVLIQRNRSISVIRRTEKLKNTRKRRGTHSSSPKKPPPSNLPQNYRGLSTTKIFHTPENVYDSVQIISTSVARKRLITVLNKQDPWNIDHRDHPYRGGKAPNRGLKATARSDRKLRDCISFKIADSHLNSDCSRMFINSFF